VFNEDRGAADWLGGEVQLSKTLWEQHRVTMGSEFRYDVDLRQRSYTLNPYLSTGNVSSHDHNFGFYAQDEFSVRTNLILNAGLRYDHFESFGCALDPRVALICSPWGATTLKAIYGQAFRAPNAYESAYQFPGYLPNPHLRPETIRSYELAWEQRLGSHWRWTTGLFYNDMNDLITQAQAPDSANPSQNDYLFRNTDKVKAYGVELELAGHWNSGVQARASYAYTQASQESAGSTWAWTPNSPHHLAKLGLSVPLWRDNLFATLEAQARSRRETVDGDVPGYMVLNFTLFSRELVHGLEASASIYNLLDRSYADPVSPDFAPVTSVPQDGRSFRIKLTYRF
jgi:iron complex outermembrane receptor protein